MKLLLILAEYECLVHVASTGAPTTLQYRLSLRQVRVLPVYRCILYKAFLSFRVHVDAKVEAMSEIPCTDKSSYPLFIQTWACADFSSFSSAVDVPRVRAGEQKIHRS